MAPLSEHEKNQLRLLEEQLHADDPTFVKSMRSMGSKTLGQRTPQKGNVMLTTGGFLLGCLMLAVGLAMHNAVGGILGFVVMVASVYSMKTPLKSSQTSFASRPKSRRAFMADLEARWDERKRNEL